jgi:hypothetical protein
MHKFLYKIQLHGQKNQKKGHKNQRRLALIMGCGTGNLRPLSKPYFHPKSLSSSSSTMMEKKLSFYEKEYIRFMWVIA